MVTKKELIFKTIWFLDLIRGAEDIASSFEKLREEENEKDHWRETSHSWASMQGSLHFVTYSLLHTLMDERQNMKIESKKKAETSSTTR